MRKPYSSSTKLGRGPEGPEGSYASKATLRAHDPSARYAGTSPTSLGRKTSSTQRCRDVAAVDRDHRARGLARLGQRNEGLRHVGRVDLDAQKVATHVVGLVEPARLGTLGDHLVGQQARAD